MARFNGLEVPQQDQSFAKEEEQILFPKDISDGRLSMGPEQAVC